ncbi:hypothetical protein HG530_004756 [Fusarium avenaceum]|nr:hypothetical protein HG530_004756 [Fusarium avenaceum]
MIPSILSNFSPDGVDVEKHTSVALALLPFLGLLFGFSFVLCVFVDLPILLPCVLSSAKEAKPPRLLSLTLLFKISACLLDLIDQLSLSHIVIVGIWILDFGKLLAFNVPPTPHQQRRHLLTIVHMTIDKIRHVHILNKRAFIDWS